MNKQLCKFKIIVLILCIALFQFCNIDVDAASSKINKTKATIYVGKTLKFSNSTDGANSLLELIDSYVFENSNLAIAMESTGHYWLSIFSFSCFNLSINVILILPLLNSMYSSSCKLIPLIIES